jgi:UDP-glucose 4-epimerase
MKVLLTGGCGYIASHILIELYAAGHSAVVIDNLSNSHYEALRRVSGIVGQDIPFYQADVRDKATLDKVFEDHAIEAVIHLAGLKAVGESVEKPLMYYDNNIGSTCALVEAMGKHAVHTLVFSSSATVYGTPETLPLVEESRVGMGITNPYGRTKFHIEEMLKDLCASDATWDVTLLRYFNPVGAHKSGLIGEDPQGIPNNLLPFVAQVAVGKLPEVKVFGNDYDTPDGTGVRDYIHVTDLARGHVSALANKECGVKVYNLATGKGVSVLELIRSFERACGKAIPYSIVGRRAGDVASCYANADKARRELGWSAQKTLDDACADSWRWQSGNPQGYLGSPRA